MQKSKCRELVGGALKTCAKVRFMRQALAALGRPVDNDAELVDCVHCPEGMDVAGGYIPSMKKVLLCQQWVTVEKEQVENTLTHEMIHAYDDARAHINWHDMTQHACTEIRAANLSGDCTLARELDRGNINPVRIGGAGARCVRRRAELSVAMANGDANDKEIQALARAAVERAWNSCYNDTAPFDEHSRSSNSF